MHNQALNIFDRSGPAKAIGLVNVRTDGNSDDGVLHFGLRLVAHFDGGEVGDGKVGLELGENANVTVRVYDGPFCYRRSDCGSGKGTNQKMVFAIFEVILLLRW